MIKLIASDIDGTLVQETRELSEELFSQIRQLKEMGILFAAATGRRYPNLRELFAPVKDDIAYVCENGTLVMYQGKVLYKEKFERRLADEIMAGILKEPGAELVVSAEGAAYLQPKNPGFRDYVENFVKYDVKVLEDIFQIPEDILKISAYQEMGVDEMAPYWQARFGGQANVVTSGNVWLDFMPLGTDKGKGLRKLAGHLGILEQSCAAFGDNYNDLEMLREAGYSFAVGAAKEEVIRTADAYTQRVEPVLEKIIKQGGNWYE